MDSRETFRFAEVSLADLATMHSPLDDLYNGVLQAIVVRGVLTSSEASLLVSALEANPTTRSRLHTDSEIEFVGKPLQWSSADLSMYLECADHVRSVCATVLADVPLLSRVRQVLETAARRPVIIAQDASGREYAPMTLRRIPSGAFVGPHFELGQLDFPAYDALKTRIDPTTLFSFYVMLRAPMKGGELVAYSLRWGAEDAECVNDRHDESGRLFDRYEPTLLTPAAGDLLLFDSGRCAHGVRIVDDVRARWTAGGLVAFERGHDRVLAWA